MRRDQDGRTERPVARWTAVLGLAVGVALIAVPATATVAAAGPGCQARPVAPPTSVTDADESPVHRSEVVRGAHAAVEPGVSDLPEISGSTESPDDAAASDVLEDSAGADPAGADPAGADPAGADPAGADPAGDDVATRTDESDGTADGTTDADTSLGGHVDGETDDAPDGSSELSLSASASPAVVEPDEVVTLVITVTNTGDGESRPVSISQVVPAGADVVGTVHGLDPGTGLLDLSSLAPGQSVTIVIPMTVPADAGTVLSMPTIDNTENGDYPLDDQACTLVTVVSSGDGGSDDTHGTESGDETSDPTYTGGGDGSGQDETGATPAPSENPATSDGQPGAAAQPGAPPGPAVSAGSGPDADGVGEQGAGQAGPPATSAGLSGNHGRGGHASPGSGSPLGRPGTGNGSIGSTTPGAATGTTNDATPGTTTPDDGSAADGAVASGTVTSEGAVTGGLPPAGGRTAVMVMGCVLLAAGCLFLGVGGRRRTHRLG